MSTAKSSISDLAPFTAHQAFTLWRLEPHRHAPGKLIKVPVHYDGITHHQLERKATATRPARAANPAPPLTAEQAQQWLAHNRDTGVGHARSGEAGYLGLGFRPAGTGLVCLDIDNCLSGGQWAPHALDAMHRFPGALLEVSTSGTGLHIWFTSTTDVGRHGRDSTGLLEMYGGGQFIAAGTVLQGDAGTDHTAAALGLLAQYWPPRAERDPAAVVQEWDDLDAAQQARTVSELQHALGYLDADDRDTWISVGQALVGLGELGMQLWDEWSATSDKYQGREDLERTGVTGDRTGYQAVFARAATTPGYVNPASRDAALQRHMAAFGHDPLPAAALQVRPEIPWTHAPAAEWKKAPYTLERFAADIAKDVTPGGRDLASLWNAAEPDPVAIAGALMSATGGNCEQVQVLMGERASRAQIQRAQREWLRWWEPIAARAVAQRLETVAIGEGMTESTLPTMLTLEDMPTRLVYVTKRSVVVERATARALVWGDAMGAYAASTYDSKPNKEGEVRQIACLPVWRASPNRVTVDVLAWDPQQGELCVPPEALAGETRAYNTWRGLRPMVAPDDWQVRVAPFLRHVEYLVPDAVQRERFLQWLAHIVQRPGELPHTSYLMIAGETGVGRNWLAGVLARVLSGYVAAGVALGPILDGKFNGRLSGKLLAVVDETREGMGDNRYTRAEALKRLITEEVRHIDPKYGVQSVERNCCRWLMFSNHIDALPLDEKDRRVEVIANPDSPMGEAYYQALYGLLRDQAFLASVRQWLGALDLSTFNPGEHASRGTAKRTAIEAVTSEVDLAVRELQREHGGAPMAYGDLTRYVKEYTGDQNVRRAAIDHAVRRVGGTMSKNRIRVGGGLERIVSLDSAEQVKIITADKIMSYRSSAEAIKAKLTGFGP